MKKASIGIIIIILVIFFATSFLKLKGHGEGEKADLPFFPIPFSSYSACQFGLKAVTASIPSSMGCLYPMCRCIVCVKCGDGICGKGENECNCPKDCEAGEGEQDETLAFEPQVYKSDDFDENAGIAYNTTKSKTQESMGILEEQLFPEPTSRFSGSGNYSIAWIENDSVKKIIEDGSFIEFEFALQKSKSNELKKFFADNNFTLNSRNSTENKDAYQKGNIVFFVHYDSGKIKKIECGELKE